MTKVKALKKLAAALGINAVAGDTVSKVIESMADKYDSAPKEIVLSSSTAESTKKFKITVVDNGTIAATEIVPPTE